MRWWPRSIRWQMLAGLLLVEGLSIALFASFLMRQQLHEVNQRTRERLAHQTTSIAVQAGEAFAWDRLGWIGLSIKMMGESPSVDFAKVTDSQGNVLFVSEGETGPATLQPAERAQIPLLSQDEPRIFLIGKNHWEGVKRIYANGQLRGFVWVETDPGWDRAQLISILRSTATFGVLWIACSGLLVLWMAPSITRPLEILHRGTSALMSSPESRGHFPLPVLRRSRELTRVCSPKVTHQSVAGVGGVDALRGHWTATRQDLARAKQPENAFWSVASHFSIPRRAFHAYGVDDTRAKPTRLRRGLYFAGSCLRRIVFSVWVTLDEHKWVILR